MGGTMHSAHIVPMTNKKQIEIRDEKDIHKFCAKRDPDLVRRRLKIIRAKQIETAANYQRQSDNNGPDFWYVLVDSNGVKMKSKAMSREEAERRNDSIRDVGLQWTRGEM